MVEHPPNHIKDLNGNFLQDLSYLLNCTQLLSAIHLFYVFTIYLTMLSVTPDYTVSNFIVITEYGLSVCREAVVA
jgi:hypothetical protein